MADLSQIKEHAEIIGADGVHVGTVDGIDGGLVATVEDGTVRLSANADVAVTFEQEEDDKR